MAVLSASKMKTTVAVMFGGKSVEHEVSIITGIQACHALNKNKYNAVPIYIGKDNFWYTGEKMGDIDTYKDMESCLAGAIRVIPVACSGRVNLVRYPMKKFGNNTVAGFDIALPAVHGTFVEDGTLSGMLEMLGVPYAGCDVMSAAVGMDKFVMKTVAKECGIPVLDCLVYTAREYALGGEKILAEIGGKLGKSVIVKPVNLGSSVGISKADNVDELKNSLDLAFNYAGRALVEPAVGHLREINCSVLGDVDEAVPSECEEPVTANEILDFGDKYLAGAAGKVGNEKSGMSSLKRKLPADISQELRTQVQSLAVKTFKSLGCSGVARVDFLNNTKTGELYVNEINTIPGSLSFYLWKETGLEFDELLERMIEIAFKRQREREALVFSYSSNILSGVSLGGSKGSKI